MQQPLTGTLPHLLRSLPVRTQGEIEAAVSEGVGRFELDYMGRGPKHIHTNLLGDFLVVRLQGVLTAAEQHLVKSLMPSLLHCESHCRRPSIADRPYMAGTTWPSFRSSCRHCLEQQFPISAHVAG